MDKIDLKKLYKSLYTPSKKEFSIVEVPPLQYLMIDGVGNPVTSQRYQEAVQTLYSIAYTLKFHVKKTQEKDFTVMGLEGLWFMPDMKEFSLATKERWCWTAMILQPDFITADLFEEARRKAAAKGKAPLTNEVRLETYSEGLCAQILYLGTYVDEAPTIAAMHQFIAAQGYLLSGKHHEIYLSDARRVAPEDNRTILRQPMKKA